MTINIKIDAPERLIAALERIADNMIIIPEEFTPATEEQTGPVPFKEEKKKEIEKKVEKIFDEHTPKKPGISPSEVKTELANISRSGKQQEVKDLISSYGVKMLSAVPDDKLEELLAKAREL